MPPMSWWKDLAPMIEAGAALIQVVVVTIGALVGGWWTWRLFVRNRLKYPRASLELSVSQIAIVKDRWRLIHTSGTITNTGDVLLNPDFAELRLRQVVPDPENLVGTGDDNHDPVLGEETEVQWPVITRREWPKEKYCLEIEPGEADSLHADFRIPISVSVVGFYFFVPNPRKKKSRVGWTYTKLCAFKEDSPMEIAEMAKAEGTPKGRVDHQQRQQKQQQSQQQQQQQQQSSQSKKK